MIAYKHQNKHSILLVCVHKNRFYIRKKRIMNIVIVFIEHLIRFWCLKMQNIKNLASAKFTFSLLASFELIRRYPISAVAWLEFQSELSPNCCNWHSKTHDKALLIRPTIPIRLKVENDDSQIAVEQPNVSAASRSLHVLMNVIFSGWIVCK